MSNHVITNGVVVEYDNQQAPDNITPFVNIDNSMSYQDSSYDGENIISVTLNGYVTGQGDISTIESWFQDDHKRLKIYHAPDGTPLLNSENVIVDKISFTNRSDKLWVNVIDYQIGLKVYVGELEYFGEEFNVSSLTHTYNISQNVLKNTTD